VVIGEKGKAQLARDQASHIKETIADVGKLRITFSQVQAGLLLWLLMYELCRSAVVTQGASLLHLGTSSHSRIFRRTP
jgi:hypothetical protein